ncbi:Fic family protein [Acidobacteria bacterium AH-259-L09]|nr:Fic family protein [Acidobacteria bacterium AH-259-L09]
MDEREFRHSPAGRLVRTPQAYWAFMPNPLPPEFQLESLVGEIADASLALGQLSGLGEMLPNPYLLIRPFLRREAVASSRIEGTRASLSDLFFFEARPQAESSGDVREVSTYVRALEYALDRLKTLPVSLRLVREMHAILMEGVRGEHSDVGQFRRTQNWIGPPGAGLSEAIFVPPPVPEMKKALGAWEKYLHKKEDLPDLVQLALIHYQFEAIHPFIDGNGRVGRLIISLLLCKREMLPTPLLYLSSFFERHRNEYYRLLLHVSKTGAWEEWIRFFLRGVAVQSRDAVERARKLQALQAEYRASIQTARSSALLTRLVDKLFESPAISVSQAAQELDVTFAAAQRNVDKLIQQGILEEVTGRDRNRVYVAKEILSLLEEKEVRRGRESEALVRSRHSS